MVHEFIDLDAGNAYMVKVIEEREFGPNIPPLTREAIFTDIIGELYQKLLPKVGPIGPNDEWTISIEIVKAPY